MKKTITLMLALAMILTFIPCVSAAEASVSYDFSITTYHNGDDYDMWSEENAFGLTISTNGAKFSGGSIGIKYDTTLVEPGSIGRKGFVAATKMEDALDDSMVANSIATNMGTWYLDTTKGYIVINVAKKTSVDFSSVTGNDDKLLTLIFAPVKDGATIDDISSAFSAIPADDQYLVDCQVKVNGGAGVFKDNNSVVYSTDAGTLAMNFPGKEPVDWTATVTTDKPAGATSEDTKFEYRTDAKDPNQIGTEAPAKRVVVFAKNTTGAPLLAQTYGVTFGRSFYPGVADVPVDSYWSIILVDTDGSFLTQDSYSYTAKVGTEEAAAGTVNVQ